MTVGTCTAFKSGNGLGIIIPAKIVKIQKIEAGNVVEVDIKNTGYKEKKRLCGFHSRKDPSHEKSIEGEAAEEEKIPI